MSFLITCHTPKGSIWTYSEDGGYGVTYYETKYLAQKRCKELNGLKVPWTHSVVEREERAA